MSVYLFSCHPLIVKNELNEARFARAFSCFTEFYVSRAKFQFPTYARDDCAMPNVSRAKFKFPTYDQYCPEFSIHSEIRQKWEVTWPRCLRQDAIIPLPVWLLRSRAKFPCNRKRTYALKIQISSWIEIRDNSDRCWSARAIIAQCIA